MSLQQVLPWWIIRQLGRIPTNVENTYERKNPSGAIILLEIVRLVADLSDREERGYECDLETMDAANVVGSSVNMIKTEKYIVQQYKRMLATNQSNGYGREAKYEIQYQLYGTNLRLRLSVSPSYVTGLHYSVPMARQHCD
jgi:hypothetical protein